MLCHTPAYLTSHRQQQHVDTPLGVGGGGQLEKALYFIPHPPAPN